MKKQMLLLIALFAQGSLINAQTILWTEQPMATLPTSVRLFRGERTSPPLKAWYLKVNMRDTSIAVRPYLTTAAGGVEGIVPMVRRFNAYAGINGGFFGGTTSLSTVVYPNEVKSQNPASLTRSGVVYPVTRSLFSVTTAREMRVNWIYHFGSRVQDIYTFAQPTPNVPGTPAPVPQQSNGSPYPTLLVGMGGAPTLVKAGVANITYNQEVMFGSGVGLDTQDPRTAVGYTADRFAILLVADGRSAVSAGVSLPELAQIMIDLGCVEAMNLDGGGSTSMAVGDSLINRPSDGMQRAIPTMLAVVRAESLQVPRPPVFERIIDTGDPGATLVGSGWFASANPGYWGTTPSQLNPIGNGSAYARFRVGTSVNALYEVYAWWVAASNRATDVPFVIKSATGQDTVRVNQSQNGSQWVRIGGTYRFANDTAHAVFISNAATTNAYVCADAVRIISYDPATADVRILSSDIPPRFALLQNSPNPFNPSTKITFSIPVGTGQRDRSEQVNPSLLSVYDMLGREVATLVDDDLQPGTYEVTFNASGLASGVYFYRLRAGKFTQAKRMVLMR
jgi:hypothetical protein